MPMVEVDENELAVLKNAYSTLNGIYKKDKIGTERLVKSAFGDKIRTSEDDAAPLIEPYAKRLEAVEERFKKLDTAQAEWMKNEQYASLRAQGYTDEGIDAIKKIMSDRKIDDVEVAAAYFDKQNPPQPAIPNGLQSSQWNFDNMTAGDDDLKELFKDEEKWADREAIKTFQEIRQGKAV